MKALFFNYTIEEVLPLSELEKYSTHRRLSVFHTKGTDCVTCGRKGTKLAWGRGKGGHSHLDLYADDFHPLTVDHIIPKSKKGTNHISNLQPMCAACNFLKGNNDNPHMVYYKPHALKVGDVVYKCTKPHKRKKRYLGIVSELLISPYTNKPSFKIEGNVNSMYTSSIAFLRLENK